MKTKNNLLGKCSFLSLAMALTLPFHQLMAQVASITVNNVNTNVMTNTKLLFGITYDSRSSLTANGANGQIGYHNANATIIPEVDSLLLIGTKWTKRERPSGSKERAGKRGTDGVGMLAMRGRERL